jgi:hypothetical protein
MVTAMADGMQNLQHLHLSTVSTKLSLNQTKRSGCKVDKMTHVKWKPWHERYRQQPQVHVLVATLPSAASDLCGSTPF